MQAISSLSGYRNVNNDSISNFAIFIIVKIRYPCLSSHEARTSQNCIKIQHTNNQYQFYHISSMNQTSGVAMTVSKLPTSVSSRYCSTSQNRKWMALRRKLGGFVMREMKMSVRTWMGLLSQFGVTGVSVGDFLIFFFGCDNCCQLLSPLAYSFCRSLYTICSSTQVSNQSGQIRQKNSMHSQKLQKSTSASSTTSSVCFLSLSVDFLTQATHSLNVLACSYVSLVIFPKSTTPKSTSIRLLNLFLLYSLGLEWFFFLLRVVQMRFIRLMHRQSSYFYCSWEWQRLRSRVKVSHKWLSGSYSRRSFMKNQSQLKKVRGAYSGYDQGSGVGQRVGSGQADFLEFFLAFLSALFWSSILVSLLLLPCFSSLFWTPFISPFTHNPYTYCQQLPASTALYSPTSGCLSDTLSRYTPSSCRSFNTRCAKPESPWSNSMLIFLARAFIFLFSTRNCYSHTEMIRFQK